MICAYSLPCGGEQRTIPRIKIMAKHRLFMNPAGLIPWKRYAKCYWASLTKNISCFVPINNGRWTFIAIPPLNYEATEVPLSQTFESWIEFHYSNLESNKGTLIFGPCGAGPVLNYSFLSSACSWKRAKEAPTLRNNGHARKTWTTGTQQLHDLSMSSWLLFIPLSSHKSTLHPSNLKKKS